MTDLTHILKRFWEVDHLISLQETSFEEQVCERFFKYIVQCNNEGRFIVQLLIKSDKSANLGESKDIATRRFKSLEKRLLNSSKMYTEYKRFMQEYIDLGHMRELIHPVEIAGKTYYFPHHVV